MSEADESDLKSFKIVLIGETAVGKTCISNYFMNETFNIDEASTSTPSFASKTIKFQEFDCSIKFVIWDTVGQEKFRSLAKIFYKSSNAAILVYDITNRKSFEEIKNYWYKQLKENCHGIDKFNFN